MADARRMGKSELFSHFAERFEVKRTQAREFFDELTTLAEKELKRSGEFVLPGMVKLVVQKRHQDPREDRRQGAYRQAVERHRPAEEVEIPRSALRQARRTPLDPARLAPGLAFSGGFLRVRQRRAATDAPW